MKLVKKVLTIVVIAFIGLVALGATGEKPHRVTGVQLTRIHQGNVTNIGITNPTHKTQEYHVIVKPAGKKAIKFNTHVSAGETVELYTTKRNNGGILLTNKVPNKFTVTAYRMSAKQSKQEAKHGYVDAGIKWTKHQITNEDK